MFTIEMLPAGYGDCLWIEYGDAKDPRRILVDGGIAGTYEALCQRIERAGPTCGFELLVVTHIDCDHIDGIVKLLANLPTGVSFKEIWFNGWKHLPLSETERLGSPQGEMLSSLIEQRNSEWNGKFGGGAVVTGESLVECTLDGGLRITLLSPTSEELRRLRPQWRRECEKAGIVPGCTESGRIALENSARLRPRRLGTSLDIRAFSQTPLSEDAALANGSSIAMLVEFEGRSVLLFADAFPKVLERSIDKLLRARGMSRLKVDACKVSHHGSQGNTSAELARKILCKKYLISTNGSLFGHPDEEAISRILVESPPPLELYFNYCKERTKLWDDPDALRRYRYRVLFPASEKAGIKVDIGGGR